jgi:DNA-binding SARP family transcriptional activator
MEVRVLGTVTPALQRGGERCVLASLALTPGRLIQVSTLIDRIWGGEPPANAEYTVASYTRAVRRAIVQAGGRREWLVSQRPGGYRLDLAPELVDYHRFTGLVAQARQERGTRTAVATYQQAVSLRRGEPLSWVPGRWADSRRYAIELEYVEAVCELFEEQLATGDFAAVAVGAGRLVAEVVPTDQMIVLAAQGFAGSGQHAAIPDFLEHATRRMWDTAEVRPSAEAVALARELVERPGARLAVPEPPARPGPPLPPLPQVSMTAHHNHTVYQSAGDQYFIEPDRRRTTG